MKEVSGYNPSKDPRLVNCKTECGNERCLAKRYGLFAEKTCPNYEEPSIVTNADRIRAMTDEELAEWIYSVQDEDALRKGNFLQPLSKERWRTWLKQEEET